MARPEKKREIGCPPLMKGFRPYGMRACREKPIQLTYEEYESLRLVGYDSLSHEEAALRMHVSRPTLTRVYNKALKNITRALIEGRSIAIEGGNYRLASEWYRCRKCHKLIEGLDQHEPCEGCDDYNKEELINLNT